MFKFIFYNNYTYQSFIINTTFSCTPPLGQELFLSVKKIIPSMSLYKAIQGIYFWNLEF